MGSDDALSAVTDFFTDPDRLSAAAGAALLLLCALLIYRRWRR